VLEFLSSAVSVFLHPWSPGIAGILAAAAAAALAFGADWTVESSVAIADRLGISPRVVGLTFVAMGTSAPEFAVSVTAATQGASDMAISNVIGSNIFNLGFILGGVALLRPLETDATTVWRDGSVLIISSVAVWALFGIDFGVERSNGALLALGLLGYLVLLYLSEAGNAASTRAVRQAASEAAGEVRARWDWLRPVGKLFLGVVLIAASAELLVEAASTIAEWFGVSEWVIGMTIVAAGTSLPEFTTSLLAAVRGHHGLSLGNMIGSDIFNVLGVLGLTALIHPVTIRPEASGSILALVGMVLIAVLFMRTHWRIGRVEGALLIALGIARWVLDFT
jgi:cation:H+ antiporter